MNYSEKFSIFEPEKFTNFIVREENRKSIILDSSVVFKWFYFKNEAGVETARALYKKTVSGYFNVMAPELLFYEITNIFRYRTDINSNLLEELFKELFQIMIFVKLDVKDYTNTYEISKKTNNSIYDSIYLTLSEKYKASFITADRKLCESLISFNYDIILLDDFINY